MKKFLRTFLRIAVYVTAILIILFFAGYFLTMGDHYIPVTAEQDPGIPYILVQDEILHIETYGDTSSQPVIVIHGGPGGDFQYLLPLMELMDEYYVVFYDQRGTGLSPRVPAEQLNIETYINDLEYIVNYFAKGRKVNIIGHSFGAMLASSYLGRNPERVNRIVLAEPGFLTPEFGNELMEKTNNFSPDLSFGILFHMVKIWFETLHVRGPDDQAKKDYFFTRLMSAPIRDHPLAGYYCNNDIENAHLPVWRAGALASRAVQRSGMDEQGRFDYSFIEGIEQYRDTVLFMSGECNTLIGPEYQERQMKLFPYARMIVIRDAGHTMFGERPDTCLQVVRSYIRNH